MAINWNKYIGSYKNQVRIAAGATAGAATAARWMSTLGIAGYAPSGGSLNPGNTTTGLVPVAGAGGFPAIESPTGNNKLYLTGVELESTVTASFAIFDVLFWAGATTIPTSGTTTVALSSQPDFSGRLPFKSDGVTIDYSQTELWAFAATANSNHTHSVSADYTDQDDNPGANTGNFSTQNRIANTMLPLQWAAGDSGVRKLEGYKVNGVTSASGTVTVAILRRLWMANCRFSSLVHGPDMARFRQVFPTSALMLALQADSTSMGLPAVRLEISHMDPDA
jgi:hypothetical protein